MTPLERLEGFDENVASLLQQWNAPAVGVAVVVDHVPVLTRGYGFRDYDKRLPFDASTLFPIASNTKLFVALAAAARDRMFRIASAPGSTLEFIERDGQIVSLDQMTGAGRFILRKV